MKNHNTFGFSLALASLILASGTMLWADNEDFDARGNACNGLPSQAELKAQLKTARGQANGGFNLDMWATVVNRDGVV
jgi:hypothetical protein